jgi:hypothetical protein
MEMTMKYSEVKDLRWADEAKSMVLCTVTFEDLPVPVPFTASPGDVEAHGVEIFQRCTAGDFGAIGDYVPLGTAHLTANAKARRDELMSEATRRIAPLQYAVDEAIATDAESALLSGWKLYSVALNRIEQQGGFPQTIAWPEPPDAQPAPSQS